VKNLAAARFGLEPLVKPHEYTRAVAMTKAQRPSDPFERAGELLAKLDREEPHRQAAIEEAFGDMAIARADLLASPLYADDPDAPLERLSALETARQCRARAARIRSESTPREAGTAQQAPARNHGD
jgi:hypothetical protein